MILWLQALFILAGLLTVSLIIGRAVAWLETKDDRGESFLKKYFGLDAVREMSAAEYLWSLLALTAAAALWVVFLAMGQSWLPLNPEHKSGLDFLRAIYLGLASATPTNLLPFSPEAKLSPLTQMLGVSPANIIVGAVGISTWRALARALGRKTIGNAWAGVWRGLLIIFPLQLLFGTVLVWQGVAQNPLGPTLQESAVASFTAHSIVSGSGSGITSANSTNAIANPTYKSDLAGLMMLIGLPMGLWLATGIMIKQVAMTERTALTMGLALALMTALTIWVMPPSPASAHWEVSQALWMTASTGSSNGSVNQTPERYGAAGMLPTFFMLLGSIPFPPAVGAGIGLLIFLMIAAGYLAALVMGRSPSFLGFSLRRAEVGTIAAGIFGPTILILVGITVIMAESATFPTLAAHGARQASAIYYAIASIAQNNGSCYSFDMSDPLWLKLGVFLIIAGRVLVLAPVVIFAGQLASQRLNPPIKSELHPAHPAAISLWLIVIFLGTLITMMPVLLMGPLLEVLR